MGQTAEITANAERDARRTLELLHKDIEKFTKQRKDLKRFMDVDAEKAEVLKAQAEKKQIIDSALKSSEEILEIAAKEAIKMREDARQQADSWLESAQKAVSYANRVTDEANALMGKAKAALTELDAKEADFKRRTDAHVEAENRAKKEAMAAVNALKIFAGQ